MKDNLRLERPSTELAASFSKMRNACMDDGKDAWTDRKQIAHTDPIAYTALLRDWAKGKSLPDGWVPGDTFWIVNGKEVVGECDVRHRLTPNLRIMGGHIGYVVHPGHRRRGIATFALQECLKVLAARGDMEALLTCAESNLASIRVIQKCGGRRIDDSTNGTLRYIIPLTTPSRPHGEPPTRTDAF